MRPFLARIFTRRFITRSVFVFACLATLIVVFYRYEAWRGRRAWEAYRAQAEQAGLKFDISAYLPPEVPEAENYAAVPFIADLFKPVDPEAPEQPPQSSLGFPETPGFHRPGRKSAVGSFNATEWRDYLLRCGWIDAATTEPARDILRALDRHRASLDAFHEAGSRPKANFPLNWEDGFAIRLPHLPVMQQASNLLAIRASARLSLGENEAAFSDVRDTLHIARALEHQPLLITALLRVSVLGQGFSPIMVGLVTHQWSDAQLQGIHEEVNRIPVLESWLTALNGERAVLNQELLKLTQTPGESLGLFFALIDDSAKPSSRSRFVASAYPRGWLYDNLVVVNRLFDEHAARIDVKTSTIGRGPSSEESLTKMIGTSWLTRARYLFARMLFPAFESIESRQLLILAQVRQIQAACALERYRRAHGKVPAKLDELVPSILPAVPRDPADDHPLRYRPADDGSYVLWSIGSDRKDDAGLDDLDKNQIDRPDWVLSIPKPPALKP